MNLKIQHKEPQILFNRKISDNEHLYLSLQNNFDSLVMQFILEGVGSIDKKEFSKAVKTASEACPIVRCIHYKNEWRDSNQDPIIHFKNKIEFDGENFSDVFPFKEKMEPTKRTAEIYFCISSGRIIFRIFHGIMDGRGAMIWINNIFKVLRNERPNEAKSTETDLSYFRKLKQSGKFANKLNFNQKPFHNYIKLKERNVYCKRLTLSKKNFNLLPKLLKVLTEHFYSEKNKFMIAVDIRRHDNSIFCTSNLALPIFLETNKNESWQEINGNYLLQLKNSSELNENNVKLNFITLCPSKLRNSLIKSLKKMQDFKKKYLFGGIISSMGKINLGSLSTSSYCAKSFYVLPIMTPFFPFCILISATNEKTELVFSAYKEIIPEKEASNLLSKVQSFLQNFN